MAERIVAALYLGSARLRSFRHSCSGRPPSLPAALVIALLYPASLRRSAFSPGPPSFSVSVCLSLRVMLCVCCCVVWLWSWCGVCGVARCAWCRYTRGRLKCTHGGVLDRHTVGREREAVVASSAYQEKPTQSSHLAPEVHQRNPWILHIFSLRIDREQRVPDSSNHSLYLLKLFAKIIPPVRNRRIVCAKTLNHLRVPLLFQAAKAVRPKNCRAPLSHRRVHFSHNTV